MYNVLITYNSMRIKDKIINVRTRSTVATGPSVLTSAVIPSHSVDASSVI